MIVEQRAIKSSRGDRVLEDVACVGRISTMWTNGPVEGRGNLPDTGGVGPLVVARLGEVYAQ